jgi:hypothetical protein
MVDADFGKSVADAVNEIGSNITAKTHTENGLAPNAKDATLIEYGKEHNCIVLTHDRNTMNERIFKPCDHGGIIIFKEKRWFPEQVATSLKALRRSGKAGLVAHHVTHLSADRAVIHTHTGIEEIQL